MSTETVTPVEIIRPNKTLTESVIDLVGEVGGLLVDAFLVMLVLGALTTDYALGFGESLLLVVGIRAASAPSGLIHYTRFRRDR